MTNRIGWQEVETIAKLILPSGWSVMVREEASVLSNAQGLYDDLITCWMSRTVELSRKEMAARAHNTGLLVDYIANALTDALTDAKPTSRHIVPRPFRKFWRRG